MKKCEIKIEKSIYNSILNDVPCAPPESGGIIGGVNGIITTYVNDFGINLSSFFRYQPDVDKLNCVIADWIAGKIDFMGMFHTHPLGDDRLSQADYKYIEAIMKGVSRYTNILCFLLVIPKEKIIGYCAINIADEISVFQTAINII